MDDDRHEVPDHLAGTPAPPYVAVIFTSLRREPADEADDGYGATAEAMERLAADQPGYLGFEAARTPGGTGITVSYWSDEAAARAWKQVGEHLLAQRAGRSRWYSDYRVRVGRVDREYGPHG